jgi:hypothetical protein
VELNLAVGQVVYELLQGVIVKVIGRRDTDDIGSPAAYIFDADQDVRLGTPPCIREAQQVFEELGLLVIGRLSETVLLFLEVERSTLLLV